MGNRDERAILWLALLMTAALGLLFGLSGLDLRLQSPGYAPGTPGGPWPLGNAQPWDAFYRWGTIPGIITAVGAVVALGASFVSPRWRPGRYPALFLVLVMALGPGLLVNAIGKGLFGRPRPADLVQFGGLLDFHPPFVPGTPGRGRSFLCGHCSMGFYFMALFFIIPGIRRWIVLSTGALLGLAIGTARVLQGSHFASDVLLCGTLMLALMAGLAPLSRRLPAVSAPTPHRKWVVLATGFLSVLAVGIFLLSTPIHSDYNWVWRAPGVSIGSQHRTRIYDWPAPGNTRITARITVERGDVFLSAARNGDPLSIHAAVNGFGFPGSGRKWSVNRTLPYANWSFAPTGFYNEFNGRIEVALVPSRISRLSIEAGQGTVVLDLKGIGNPLVLRASPDFTPPRGFVPAKDGSWKRAGTGPVLEVEIRAERIEIN